MFSSSLLFEGLLCNLYREREWKGTSSFSYFMLENPGCPLTCLLCDFRAFNFTVGDPGSYECYLSSSERMV